MEKPTHKSSHNRDQKSHDRKSHDNRRNSHSISRSHDYHTSTSLLGDPPNRRSLLNSPPPFNDVRSLSFEHTRVPEDLFHSFRENHPRRDLSTDNYSNYDPYLLIPLSPPRYEALPTRYNPPSPRYDPPSPRYDPPRISSTPYHNRHHHYDNNFPRNPMNAPPPPPPLLSTPPSFLFPYSSPREREGFRRDDRNKRRDNDSSYSSKRNSTEYSSFNNYNRKKRY